MQLPALLMKITDFDYPLPANLIAQYPLADRSAARMLLLEREKGIFQDHRVHEFPQQLRAGDVVVLNNTKVIPARLFARKSSGGKVEILIERLLGTRLCLAQCRASRAPRINAVLTLVAPVPSTLSTIRVRERQEDFFILEAEADWLTLMTQYGQTPLPPYITRTPEDQDSERYQTIFAHRPGAVAAPTAGLHIDAAMLHQLHARGIGIAEITLHVGAGTFQPVRSRMIQDHHMHQEWMEIDAKTARLLNTACGRIVAVGTTVVRCLESATDTQGKIHAYCGDTDIFIYPGYHFRKINGLLTNFHLPQSTLLMLVSALAGRERVMAAYRHAIAQGYRFFSYGDAMLIL